MSKISEESRKEQAQSHRSKKAASEPSRKDAAKLRPIIGDLFTEESATHSALVNDVKRLKTEQHAGFDAAAFYEAHEHAIWGLLYDTATGQNNVNILRYLGGLKGATNVTSLEDLQHLLAYWAKARIGKDLDTDQLV